MIVSPELISASSAPSARPLNNWEIKLGQLIMENDLGPDLQMNGVAARALIKKLAPRQALACLRRQESGSTHVYAPRLQPNASGFCINPSPVTISTTSQKSSLPF